MTFCVYCWAEIEWVYSQWNWNRCAALCNHLFFCKTIPKWDNVLLLSVLCVWKNEYFMSIVGKVWKSSMYINVNAFRLHFGRILMRIFLLKKFYSFFLFIWDVCEFEFDSVWDGLKSKQIEIIWWKSFGNICLFLKVFR